MKKKLLYIIIFINSFAVQAQFSHAENFYIFGLNKVYRLYHVVLLTEASQANYKKVVNQLKHDSIYQDVEYFLSKSIFIYKLYGKKKTYSFLNEIFANKKINDEELYFAKSWLALFTQNIYEYDKLFAKFKSLYPDSSFILRLKALKYIFIDSNYWSQVDKMYLPIVKEIEDYFSSHNLSNFDQVYFKLLIFDLQKPGSFQSLERKRIRKMIKLIHKYPDLELSPYYDMELHPEKHMFYWTSLTDSPGRNDRKNWKNFDAFLRRNPFFAKYKLTKGGYDSGISIFDYPETESIEQVNEAIKTYNKLIPKYPGMHSFCRAKLILYKFHFEDFPDKKQMAKDYIASLICIFENYGDYCLKSLKSGIAFSCDKEYLKKYLKYLDKKATKQLISLLNSAVKREPEHKNLLFLKRFIDDYYKKRFG